MFRQLIRELIMTSSSCSTAALLLLVSVLASPAVCEVGVWQCPCVQEVQEAGGDRLRCEGWQDSCPHTALPPTSHLTVTNSPRLQRITEDNIISKGGRHEFSLNYSLSNSSRKTDGFPQGLYNLSITNTGLTELQLAQFPELTLLDLRHNLLTSLDRPRSGNIKELYLAGNAWTCFTREPYRSNIYSRSHLSAHSHHKFGVVFKLTTD